MGCGYSSINTADVLESKKSKRLTTAAIASGTLCGKSDEFTDAMEQSQLTASHWAQSHLALLSDILSLQRELHASLKRREAATQSCISTTGQPATSSPTATQEYRASSACPVSPLTAVYHARLAETASISTLQMAHAISTNMSSRTIKSPY
ncbi:hypothetical protein BSLG_003609 [Batrachochytrium salamandrivorans]|nr:hypothetical protein BSLG_003609 [Batrachochytrium salamandrivorans]